MSVTLNCLLSSFSLSLSGRAPWLILTGVLVIASCILIYAALGRWGRHNALTRCAVLSVWVHLLLLVGAYLTNGLPGGPGVASRGSRDIHVRWVEDADEPLEMTDAATETPLLESNAETPPVLPGTQSIEETLPAEQQANGSDALPKPLAEHADLSETDTLPTDDVPAAAVVESPQTPAIPEPAADAVSAPTSERAPVAVEPVAVDEPVADLLNDADLLEATASREEPSPHTIDEMAARPELADPATTPTELPGREDSFHHVAASQRPLKAISRRERTLASTEVGEQQRPTGAANSRPPVAVPQKYQGRDASRRRELAEARGGSVDTEAAVEHGLAWLASAQSRRDGRWETGRWGGGTETRELVGDVRVGIQADSAATGLALLAFLGAGYTHVDGPYRQPIHDGIQYLLANQAPDTGSLAGNASRYVAMYSHGIATLALSEALIMSGDAQLRPAVERAVAYTMSCQHPVTGGWRYQPGDQGDTSQFGWQLMSLVSAQAAGVHVPTVTLRRAEGWLDRVAMGNNRGLACYIPERRIASPSMTAEAMVCRTFIGQNRSFGADDEAANFIAEQALRSDPTRDLYFSYYATLALFPLQDERWQTWNRRLTHALLRQQRDSGNLTGSWDTHTRWGPTGGRVYTTSMACLCLETYYRYLPVYELAMDRGRAQRR